MRLIKFRAWDKEEEVMLSDVDLNTTIDTWDTINEVFTNMTDELHLMQYTGLKDKNDRELFESDITKDKYGNISVCCWIDEVSAYAFVPIQIYPNKSWHAIFEEQGEDTFFRNDDPHIYHEVIGNIYEDKHLLEVQT